MKNPFGKHSTPEYEPYMCADMLELILRIRNSADNLLTCPEQPYPETPIENIFGWAQDLVEYVKDED